MSTDTRHPQYDDATLQAAIDWACTNSATPLLLAMAPAVEKWDNQAPARLALARGLLASLPEPQPPTADGKTPGQVAFEAWGNEPDEWHKSLCSNWQAAASAVLAAFGGTGLEQAIARIEAVPWKELDREWDNALGGYENAINAVRARLIAAAREGFGPAAVDWKARHDELQKAYAGHADVTAALHAKVQKAEAELARIVAAAHEAGWNGVENSKDLAQFIKDQEATLESWSTHINPEDHDRIVKSVQDRAKAAIAEARQEGLSTLRPIAEAGDVPAGAVRVFAMHHKITGKWLFAVTQAAGDTQFADILPPEAKAPAVEAAEPTPAQAPPPWQPAVGEPVRLVSGGPKMTIGEVSSDGIGCDWFDELGKWHGMMFKPACLVSAKEAQP